jgi:hypothetical protein
MNILQIILCKQIVITKWLQILEDFLTIFLCYVQINWTDVDQIWYDAPPAWKLCAEQVNTPQIQQKIK